MNRGLEWTTWPLWVFYAWYWYPLDCGCLEQYDDVTAIFAIAELVRRVTANTR